MRKWVTLPDTDGSIERWYYTSSVEEEVLCDVASVDYEKHVRLECVEMDEHQHIIDVRTMHPIQNALVLFYSQGYECIHMIGALTYQQIMDLNGIITSYTLSKSRSRFCPFDLPMETHKECTIPVSELPFPLHGPTDMWNDGDEAYTNVNLQVAVEYYKDPTTNPAPSRHLRATSVMGMWIGVWIEYCDLPRHSRMADPRMIRNRFENLRFDAEWTMLKAMMPQYVTQSSLIRLLEHNGMKTWFDNNSCEPTALDLQCFLRDYPRYPYIPTVFIVIHVTLFPTRRLPVYQNGSVHIPLVWEDVQAWMWHVRQLEAQNAYSEWDQTRWSELPQHIVEYIAPYARSMTTWLIQNNTTVKRRRKKGTPMVVPETQMDITDMEDMWRALPPCIASLRHSHFPKNKERIQLTSILVEAGISLDTATTFYETHHGNYPNGQDFKSRYNVSGSWDYAIKSGKNPVMCWQLIKAAKLNTPESLHCPFAKKSTLPDGDELRSHCYVACAGKRFGGRPALRIRPDTYESKPTVEQPMLYFSSSEEEDCDGGV